MSNERPVTAPAQISGAPERVSRTVSNGSVTRTRVLVVDDEAAITQALERFLRSRGYEVQTAASGQEALAALQGDRFAAMVCDVRMPGLSGVDVVPQALDIDPDLAILMLSGVNDAPTATRALATGALDYLLKPVELAVLHNAIERALHRRSLEIDRRTVERVIRQEIAARSDELEREKQAQRSLMMSIVESLINAMEAKDQYLRGHSQRVAELSASMAQELGLDADTVEQIRVAARIHDVGKIGIREEVLNKPGRLSPEEFEHVKDHVRIGMEILAPLKHLAPALLYVQDHHEHWDGRGYPNGKAGDAISIGGRILAAADAFDALTSVRAYRGPRNAQETIVYLRTDDAGLLDPAAYRALASVVLRRKSLAASFLEA